MASIEKTVFISYRRKDRYEALAVYQYLTSQQYDVFLDYTSIPSGDFEQIIVSNIKARAHFILILTSTALDRTSEPEDWLRREIEAALLPLIFNGICSAYRLSEQSVDSIHQRIRGADKKRSPTACMPCCPTRLASLK